MAGLNDWMGPTQVLGPRERQALIEAGVMTREDFMDKPVPSATPVQPPVGGSSAQEDLARSLGLTVPQLIAKQDAQKREMMKKQNEMARKLKGYASGGAVKPAYTGTTPREANPWIRNLKALNPFEAYDPTVEQEPLFEQEANTYDERMTRAQGRLNEFAADMVLDPLNLVSGAVLGKLLKGVGSVGKRALAPTSMAVGSAAYGSDAEASKLGALTELRQKMLQMMYRGRSSHTPIEERAMFMSPSPRYAEEYAKRRVGQIGGERTVDSYLVDPFAVERRGHNITPEGGGNMQSMIAYPKTNEAEYRGSRNFAGGGMIGALGRIAKRLGSEAAPTRRGVTDIIKERGGQWLNGSVEDALKSTLKTSVSGMSPEDRLAELQKYAPNVTRPESIEALNVDMARQQRNIALNNWTKGPLTKHIKRDMGTANDPFVKLADQGIMVNEAPYTPNAGGPLKIKRSRQGHNPYGDAKTEAGKAWENTNDTLITQQSAADFRRLPYMLEENPWLAALADDTPVHSIGEDALYEGGIAHMLDELSNAVDPNSGLPSHLRVHPDQLRSGNFSVDAAIRRISDINKWRADVTTAANQAKANNTATHLHKDYGDGLKWVELKGGDKKALQEALDYEGAAMKHCVGGYCDDITDGRSQIYSLRDSTGQPHVTIETAPRYAEDLLAEGNPEYSQLYDEIGAKLEREFPGEDDYHDRILTELNASTGRLSNPIGIIQIKGKQNKAPKAEYLPYVQDFVKSGQWSNVGDLQNTGMWKHPKTGAYHTKAELATNPELEDIYASRNLDADGNYRPGFASGGVIDYNDLHGY